MKFESQCRCPLTPALRRHLQACIDCNTVDTSILAEKLCCSPETIRSNFKLASNALDTHSRFETVFLCVLQGWPVPPPPRTRINLIRDHLKNTPICGYTPAMQSVILHSSSVNVALGP